MWLVSGLTFIGLMFVIIHRLGSPVAIIHETGTVTQPLERIYSKSCQPKVVGARLDAGESGEAPDYVAGAAMVEVSTGGSVSEQTVFERNLVSQMSAVEKESDPMEREYLLADLIGGVEIVDVPEAILLLRGQERTELSRGLELRLIREWAVKESGAVAEWVTQNPDVEIQKDVVKAVAIEWANQDIWAAIEWAGKLEDDEEWAGAQSSISYEAVRTEPVLALVLAEALPSGSSRDDLIVHAASEWAVRVPVAARNWGIQVSDESLCARVIGGIARSWSETDPVAGATLAVKAIGPDRNQNDAIVSIVQRWVQRDPYSVAQWVSQFPEGELRCTAVGNLVNLWAENDPGSAGEWVSSLPLGCSRDSAVAAYVCKVALQSPENMGECLGFINDCELRAHVMKAVDEYRQGATSQRPVEHRQTRKLLL